MSTPAAGQEPSDLGQLRHQVRAFLTAQRAAGGFEPRCDSWLSGYSEEFSRALGAQGWLGMTWPRAYGGHERSEVERYTVNEELLAAGAPVAAHWFADRQIGPGLLRYGSEQQRQAFLPAMARGELYFAIGMSEPDSGSDLASIRTAARACRGGWRVTGTKVWTSHAHRAHYLLALVRTGERQADRHAGLSQLIIDLTAPGVLVSPVEFLDGEQHFNEVVLDDVFVPGQNILGAEGGGWQQVTSELAFERSGPERILSTFPLLAELVRRHGRERDPDVGLLVAELGTLRQMSRDVALAIGSGLVPAVEAAVVKDLGTRFENRVIEVARQVAQVEPDPGSGDPLVRLLAQAVLHAPAFTLRGGTNEILRGIVARTVTRQVSSGIGAAASGPIAETVGRRAADAADAPALYAVLRRDGWTTAGIPESGGGSGGGLAEAAEVTAALAGAGASLPVADTAIVASCLLAAGQLRLPRTARCVVPAWSQDAVVSAGRVSAYLSRVPWASWASHVLLACPAGPDQAAVALLETGGAAISRGDNLAGEPRDDIRLTDVPAAAIVTVDRRYSDVAEQVLAAGALARSIQIAAAARQVLDMTARYCTERVQFGEPIAARQAVQQQLAELAAETAAAGAAAALALAAATGTAGSMTSAVTEIAIAKARTSQAAGVIARIAHQLHGAIGVTGEHPLPRYSRALWSWREEYGTQAYWSGLLADRLAGQAADLWDWLTAAEMAQGRAHATRLRGRQRGAPVVGGGFDEPERPHLQHGQARA